MIAIRETHPAYEKINQLTQVLGCAINRQPFTPYQYMPEPELSIEIAGIEEEIQRELDLIERGSRNYLN